MNKTKGMDNKMNNKVLTLNFIIIFLLTYGIFNPIVGVVFTSISMLISLTKSDTSFGEWVIKKLVKKKGKVSDNLATSGRKVLLSADFIGLALKCGALYGTYLVAGVTVIMFVALVLAFGLLFESRPGDFSGAFYLAKLVAKIAVMIDSLLDPVINFIIRKEFEWLGIETI